MSGLCGKELIHMKGGHCDPLNRELGENPEQPHLKRVLKKVLVKKKNDGIKLHFLLFQQYFPSYCQLQFIRMNLKTITRRENFLLVQNETNCRRHSKVHLK